MLTALTYNCDSERLGKVEPEVWTTAFENEIRVCPEFRKLKIHVTFCDENSGVVGYRAVDVMGELANLDRYEELFDLCAERAFRVVTESLTTVTTGSNDHENLL